MVSLDMRGGGLAGRVFRRPRLFYYAAQLASIHPRRRHDVEVGGGGGSYTNSSGSKGGISRFYLRGGATTSSPSIMEIAYDGAGPPFSAVDNERDLDAQISASLREDRGSAAGPSIRQHLSPDSSSSNEGNIHVIEEQDIRTSAEKIVNTYLLQGAEREITLPGSISSDVMNALEESRFSPDIFDIAMNYVYQAMEREAYPNFLRMKALGNLTPPTLVLRLLLGLASLWAAFWAAFVLIFLDLSRQTRTWVRALPWSCHTNVKAI